MSNLTLAATAGRVTIITDDGTRIAMTPEVADQLAKHLPDKANQARMLAAAEPGVAEMSDALRALGYSWRVADAEKQTGWWRMRREQMTLCCHYEAATRSLYYSLVKPLENGMRH